MKTAIISDIHGNLEALNSLFVDLDRKKITEILCLGDIVGYGANPNECVEEIRRRNIITISGNHDGVCSEKVEPDNFNPYAKEAIYWCIKELTKDNKQFLTSLPAKIKKGEILFIHGSPYAKDEYVISYEDAYKGFSSMKSQGIRICFIGHTHQPKIWHFNSPEINVVKIEYNKLISLKGGEYIINVGSIGQPRDGNIKGRFILYDFENSELIFEEFDYDIKKAAFKILNAGLPPFLSERLFVGI